MKQTNGIKKRVKVNNKEKTVKTNHSKWNFINNYRLWKQRMNTKLAILVPSLIALVTGVSVVVVLVSNLSSQAAYNLTEDLVSATVQEYVNEFKAIASETYGAMTAVAPVVDSIAQTSKEPREDILQVLVGVLSNNDSMLAAWSVWEPDVLDGRDRQYANTRNHDSTGRYIPYVIKKGKLLTYSKVEGYDQPNEFYDIPKSTKNPCITNPYFYNVDGENMLIYSISVPIIRDGKFVGVVGADVKMENIQEKMSTGRILDDGYIFTFSPNGKIASHRDSDKLLDYYGDTWMALMSDQLENLFLNGGEISAQMYSDIIGTEVQFLARGVMIGDTGRYWAVCGVVPVSNIKESSVLLTAVTVLLGVALIVVMSLIIIGNLRKRLNDLPVITNVAEALAVGDIDAVNAANLDTGTENTKNEITLLSRTFARMAQEIRQQANEMLRIAQGDYSGVMPVRCENDVMNKAINQLLDATNATLSQINAVSAQVSIGAKQLADGAQMLASGSTEQAASIQELSSAIGKVAEQTKKNVEMSARAARIANDMREKAEEGTRQMNHMMAAVQDISASSHDISKVIKVIDDIAFQTNILALNAAVEAARAGAAGKGFAVVADEVRNLAAKSAEAAKNTSSLIENSISKAEVGVKIAKDTSEALGAIIAEVNETTEIVQSIAEASEQQSAAIEEINVGIEQVANVVQQNSATAEESAASSEEMSGQADVMASLVAQFKLRNSAPAPQPCQEALPGLKYQEESSDAPAFPSGFAFNKY